MRKCSFTTFLQPDKFEIDKIGIDLTNVKVVVTCQQPIKSSIHLLKVKTHTLVLSADHRNAFIYTAWKHEYHKPLQVVKQSTEYVIVNCHGMVEFNMTTQNIVSLIFISFTLRT